MIEKYGVDEDSVENEKLAAEGCPKCGSKNVQTHGNVLMCPNCGSEPWEKKDD